MTESVKIKLMASTICLYFVLGLGFPAYQFAIRGEFGEAMVSVVVAIGVCWIIRRLARDALNSIQSQEK